MTFENGMSGPLVPWGGGARSISGNTTTHKGKAPSPGLTEKAFFNKGNRDGEGKKSHWTGKGD